MTTTFRAQSPSVFKDLAEAGQWQQRALSAHGTLDATAIKGPTSGSNFAMNTGTAEVTGSLLGIVSGLSQVDRVLVSLVSAVATNFIVTTQVSPTDVSKFDIFCWMPTAAGNTTPTAATALATVSWLAIGTQS